MTSVANSASHTDTVDYAFIHVAKHEMSVERLLGRLYNHPKPGVVDYFRLLNTHLKDGRVLAGQPVIVSPPGGTECRALEFELMDLVQRLEKTRETLLFRDAEILGSYYGLLDNIAQYSGVGYGMSLNYFRNYAKQIETVLKTIEEGYTAQYNLHGHLRNEGFFIQRRRHFQKLKVLLKGMVGRSVLGPHIDSYDIRRSLDLSTKSIMHKLKTQGGHPATSIPGFETNYAKAAKLSSKLRHAGYLGIALDIGQSSARIHQACTLDREKEQCGRTGFKETGRVTGNVMGGTLGGAAAYAACNVLFGVESLGTSFLWCGIVVGAASGYVGGNFVSGLGEDAGDFLYETTISILD